MIKRYVLIILLLIIFSSSALKVSAATTNPETPAASSSIDAKIETDASSFIIRSKNFIVQHTPNFIKNSINSAVEITEEFRQGLVDKLAVKKIDLELEISSSQSKDSVTIPDQKSWQEKIKPFLVKIELFFTNIFLVILSSTTLFYSISVIIVILFVRFIWLRIL